MIQMRDMHKRPVTYVCRYYQRLYQRAQERQRDLRSFTEF